MRLSFLLRSLGEGKLLCFSITFVTNGYFLQFSEKTEGTFQAVSRNKVISLCHQILVVDELHYYTGLLGR